MTSNRRGRVVTGPTEHPLDVLRELVEDARAGYPPDVAEVYAAALRAVEQLEKTLKWYAERRNHTPPAGTPSMPPSSGGWLGTNDSFDGNGPGARARAALALFDRKEQTP